MKEGDVFNESRYTIIGAGLYGLYAALFLAKKGKEPIYVIESEPFPFSRATYVNQARVHMGYHYPRSLSTACKSAHYFKRFVSDFDFAIYKKFHQIYATSTNFSWTNATQFKNFCKNAGIKCEELDPNRFFRKGQCDGAFLTEEYTYDAKVLRDYFVNELEKYPHVKICYNEKIVGIDRDGDHFTISTNDGLKIKTPFILNATYASTNQISQFLGLKPFKIKYELCEIILCTPSPKFKKYGITVMDGPFFSVMPFGLTNYHSLTAVSFTPHYACYSDMPSFPCQRAEFARCHESLGNCNTCQAKPESAYPYMNTLAAKYLNDDYTLEYKESLFSIKPILCSSEVDDSRPTVIRKLIDSPTFISVLSGKINTVYDLDEVLDDA